MTGAVVDSSALAAICFGEPEYERFVELLSSAEPAVLSAATLTEVSMVVEARKGLSGAAMLDRTLRNAEIDVVEVSEVDARNAVVAWRRYGKGNHRAALNFGDCFVYALAEVRGYPIVCDGNDFAQTDLEVLPAR